ncbi:MAG: MurR/RpiR family transcriptional regulator [Eubacteriales bacterium]
MRTKNISIHISEVYQNLTKSEKKIADFITSNPYDAQYMSITSLAEECNVADATISRFCRSLGYQSYNEFKLALAKHMAPSTTMANIPPEGKPTATDSVSNMAQKLYIANDRAMKQSLDLINPKQITLAAKYLYNANRVYCFGQGGSGILAKEAWARFISVSPRFQCIEDNHMQIMAASLCDTTDVILFFSYSGATRDIVDILKIAKESGARVILITHFPKCPAAIYADVIILCGSKESPLHGGSIAAKIGQLFLIDVLFNEYCRFNPDQYTTNRELTSEALANKHV